MRERFDNTVRNGLESGLSGIHASEDLIQRTLRRIEAESRDDAPSVITPIDGDFIARYLKEGRTDI